MTDELKPCPFCGGEAACIEETAWRIGCDNGQCAAEPFVWEPSKEMAIAAWNTRADLANPLADPLVAALVEAATELHDKAVEKHQRHRSDIWPVIRKLRAALSALEDRT